MTGRAAFYTLLYTVVGGLPLILAGLGPGQHVVPWWLSGIVLAAAFAPVAIYGPRGVLAQFAVIAPAIFTITVFCTWTEALVFMPALRQNAASNLVGATVMYGVVSVVLAVLAGRLKLTRPADAASPPLLHRPLLGVIGMVVVSGIAFAIYYLIFGAITYQFFTRGFYPEATQQVAALGNWFWAMQIGRGILMTASMLPIIYTLRLTRAQTALVVGLILWVAGGLAPLLVPNELMGGTQRLIHIVEIFTQNVPFGITAVLLLRPRPRIGTVPSLT